MVRIRMVRRAIFVADVFFLPFLGDLRLPTRQVTGVTRAPNAPGANSTPQDNCLSICRRRAARGAGHLQRMRRRGKYSGAELNNAKQEWSAAGRRACRGHSDAINASSQPAPQDEPFKNSIQVLVSRGNAVLDTRCSDLVPIGRHNSALLHRVCIGRRRTGVSLRSGAEHL